MVDLNKLLPTVRLAVFSFVIALAVIDFAIACHLLSLYSAGFYYEFMALALATAILTLISLPVMLWLSFVRKGAFPTYIATEVGVCWFLWIMWVATAGSTTWVNYLGTGGIVSESQALEAMAFLNWAALLFYTNFLFVVAIISHHKGTSGVWTSSVREFDFNTAVNQNKSTIPHVAPQMSGQPAMAQQPYYPPQQQLAPQAAYTPQHTGNTGFAGQPQGTPNQPPVAMV